MHDTLNVLDSLVAFQSLSMACVDSGRSLGIVLNNNSRLKFTDNIGTLKLVLLKMNHIKGTAPRNVN